MDMADRCVPDEEEAGVDMGEAGTGECTSEERAAAAAATVRELPEVPNFTYHTEQTDSIPEQSERIDIQNLRTVPSIGEPQPSTVSVTSNSPAVAADTVTVKRRRLGRKIHIAVAGCSHGEMDKIYASLAEIERRQGYKFDLLISCGDYQAVRNTDDLMHMHVPEKYRQMQTFYRYYSGELKAPILTIFIGGNHEASGFLQELPNGGWVAPNIFYLGHASVVQFAGLRIAGASGIYNKNHYDMGHWERPPFAEYGAIVSVYHVRSVDMFRLKQLKAKNPDDPPIDIMITHDWPAGITDYGDVEQLLRLKPYFEEDLKKNAIGNPAAMTLLHELRPRFWLAAHLHCSFAALVPHHNKNDPENDFAPTRFLSLDKPIPKRHFLQALEFDVDENAPLALSYDPIWLAILRATDALTSASKNRTYMPSQHTRNERWDFRPTEEEIEEVRKIFADNFTIPMNFRQTARPHRTDGSVDIAQNVYYRNPQTTEFCAKLGIQNLNEMLCSVSTDELGTPYYLLNSDNDFERVAATATVECGSTQQDTDIDDNDGFVIDRIPASEPSFLKDFKAPALRTEDLSNSRSSDATDSNEQRSETGIDESARGVGSGIFRRRPVNDIPEEE